MGPETSWRQDFGTADAAPFPAGCPAQVSPAAQAGCSGEPGIARGSEAEAGAGSAAVARRPGNLGALEEVLQDAVELGDKELAGQAQPMLNQHLARKGGLAEEPEVRATAVRWTTGPEPGEAQTCMRGQMRGVQDYRGRLPVTPELAKYVPSAKPGDLEERQCVVVKTEAAYLMATRGASPAPTQALKLAQGWRLTVREDAREAECFMGEADARITITESDVRMFCHDSACLNHDEDYRCLAASPPGAPHGAAGRVVRARLELVVGKKYEPGKGCDLTCGCP